MNEKAWGKHLILDLRGCPESLLKDKAHILEWSSELVKTIEMVAFGEPLLEHFATHKKETGGYTLVQLIETSNICAHFAENIGCVYIDIFSCQDFDESKAVFLCESYFKPKEGTSKVLIRGMATDYSSSPSD